MPKIQHHTNRHAGFTLVELIIVIILIGVLAVSAFSRFSGTSGFVEYTYQARLISALRNMQTRAMFDNRANFCFKLIFDQSTPAFGPPVLNYAPVGNAADTCGNSIDFSNPDYLATSSTEMTSEGVAITTTPSFNWVNFDNLGRPSIDSSDCSGTCKITLSGESAVSVCIEPQGFIHACE
ncbi:prepilin-type N-terminal cleavage/methylation domain-containing protein [Paraglaciecola aestuariivivens]